MSAPGWPRAMKRATAAAYCDMSETAFEREVLEGRFPVSFKVGGREHWCRNALDKALDIITGAAQDDEPDYRKALREKYGTQAA